MNVFSAFGIRISVFLLLTFHREGDNITQREKKKHHLIIVMVILNREKTILRTRSMGKK